MAVSSPGQRRKLSPAPWHGLFLSMLPTIRRHAEGAFGHLRHDHCDDFDDALSEVVAHALVVFVALVELGKTDLAFPEVLARHGVDQARSGRRVGNCSVDRDCLSLTQGAVSYTHLRAHET